MKKPFIACMAAVALVASTGCTNVATNTRATVRDTVEDPVGTTSTVAHNLNPMATDTSTKSVQRSLQTPTVSARQDNAN